MRKTKILSCISLVKEKIIIFLNPISFFVLFYPGSVCLYILSAWKLLLRFLLPPFAVAPTHPHSSSPQRTTSFCHPDYTFNLQIIVAVFHTALLIIFFQILSLLFHTHSHNAKKYQFSVI